MVKTKRRRSYRAKIKRRFRRLDKRVPLLTMLPIAHKLILEPLLGNGQDIAGALGKAQSGDMQGAATEFVDVIGINFLGHKFSDNTGWWGAGRGSSPYKTYAEIGLGMAGSWAANKFGVNRQIRKVPYVGKYIKL